MSFITPYIIRGLISLSGQPILLPFYHAVTDTPPDFSKRLYPPRSIANFKRDLDVLIRYYKPISLQELITLNQSDQKLTQKYFHLTFDDGLSNFYDEVAPILEERNIPATVFLNTHFVDNKDLFFRYKTSLLLDKYHKFDNDTKLIYKQFIEEQSLKHSSISTFLMSITYQNKQLLDDLAKRLGICFIDFLKKKKPYLTLSQIKELQTRGFTFGSHSSNHPLFEDLHIDEQEKQVLDSFDWISENINTSYKAFSFPFEDAGVSKAFFDNIAMDISFGTYGLKKDIISTNLQRISFELADADTELFLLKEYSKYLIKILLRKHIIKRG